MALKSTAYTALTSPVSRTENADLLADMPQVNSTVINPRQLLALEVYFMLMRLNTMSGSDYTTATTGLNQLADDTAALLGGISTAELKLADALLEYNEAVVVGATISTDVETLLETTKDYAALDEDTLKRMKVCLKYQLSSLATAS